MYWLQVNEYPVNIGHTELEQIEHLFGQHYHNGDAYHDVQCWIGRAGAIFLKLSGQTNQQPGDKNPPP